jgi:hypothetical protein
LTSHVAFNLRDAAGFICTETEHPITVTANDTQVVKNEPQFGPASLCWASGLQLVRSFRYEITIVGDQSVPWCRSDYKTDLAGFDISSLPNIWSLDGLYARTAMFLEVPIRRVWYRPWFRIIARIGRLGADEYFLDPDYPIRPNLSELKVAITPKRTGELFLYVNDAVTGVPNWET